MTEFPHQTLLTWMGIERRLRKTLDDAGLSENDRDRLLEWGQEKFIERLDKPIEVTGELQLESWDKAGVETAFRVATDSMISQMREQVTEPIMWLFIDLLMMKFKVTKLEEALGMNGEDPVSDG